MGKKIWLSTHPINFGNHVTVRPHARTPARPQACTPARPPVRPHHRHTRSENNSIERYGNPNATRGYFGGKSDSHPRLVKQRHEESIKRRKWKAEIVFESVLSKVLSLDELSCPQIWNIEQEKDKGKEKVGGRPAKLNEQKSDGDLEREIKNKGDINLLEEQNEDFVAAVRK